MNMLKYCAICIILGFAAAIGYESRDRRIRRQQFSSSVISSNEATIISNGGGSSSVIMTNGQTCINNRCYPRGFSSVKSFSGGKCPTVVCDGCSGYNGDYRIWTDGCPICTCGNSGTRQPCDQQSPCNTGAVCRNYVCTYDNVPPNLPIACDMDFQCQSDHSCSDGQCRAGATRRHAENRSCVFQHQCPKGYTCENTQMTCYEGAAVDHAEGQSCVFTHQCPNYFECSGMSCWATSRQHIPGRVCVLPGSCPEGYSCQGMTCFADF